MALCKLGDLDARLDCVSQRAECTVTSSLCLWLSLVVHCQVSYDGQINTGHWLSRPITKPPKNQLAMQQVEILSFKRIMKSKSTVNNKILLLTLLRTPKVKTFIPYLVGSDQRTEKEMLEELRKSIFVFMFYNLRGEKSGLRRTIRLSH